MYSIPISDIKDRYQEVFDHAVDEPVMLLNQSQPSHVVLSAEHYRSLVVRLQELEDQVFGKAAERALQDSCKAGAERFTGELRRIANG